MSTASSVIQTFAVIICLSLMRLAKIQRCIKPNTLIILKTSFGRCNSRRIFWVCITILWGWRLRVKILSTGTLLRKTLAAKSFIIDVWHDLTLYKNWSFQWRNSSVNVTKSAGNFNRNPSWKTSFFYALLNTSPSY